MGSLIDYVESTDQKYTRIDELDANTWVVGYTNSPSVVPDSSPFWAIQRISKSGTVVTVEWANDGKYISNWTDRYTYFGISGFSNLKSVFFDGANDYCRPSAIITPFGRTSTFSVSIWVCPLSLAANQFLVGNMQNISNQGWSLRTENAAGSGKIVFAMVQTATTNEWRVTTNNTYLQIGQWTHIVATYDGSGSASGATIYVNGASVALTTNLNTLSSNPSSSVTMHVGANAAATPGNFFLGYIDELSIHSNTLTSGNASTLYNSGVPTNLANQAFYGTTLLWYRMGDNDTFPILVDQKAGVNTNLQMYNSTSNQISSTVP